MIENMKSTWEQRDLPVLDAIVTYVDDHPGYPFMTLYQVAELTGFDLRAVHQATASLDGLYIEVLKTATGGNPGPWLIVEVTPFARRQVGQWPSLAEYAQRLILALEEQASESTDRHEQGKLNKAAKVLRDVGVDVLTAVVAKSLTGSI